MAVNREENSKSDLPLARIKNGLKTAIKMNIPDSILKRVPNMVPNTRRQFLQKEDFFLWAEDQKISANPQLWTLLLFQFDLTNFFESVEVSVVAVNLRPRPAPSPSLHQIETFSVLDGILLFQSQNNFFEAEAR